MALELSPEIDDAYVNRAQVKQSMKDFAGAFADYDRAIQLRPDAGVFYARGTARQQHNDLNGAAADYSKAIELNPSMAQAFANRAVVETLQGKKSAARADFNRAFALDPSLRGPLKECVEKRLNRP